MTNPLAMNGRRYVVTGAASGIGQATAVLLSRLGATVACIDVDGTGLQETRTLLDGDGHIIATEDLGALKETPKVLASVVGSIGKLHGFVHAAGVPGPSPLASLSPDLWRRVFLINTEAGLALAQAFQRRTIYAGERGSIVFISSVMARLGSTANAAYAGSKSALEGITRSLAIELARRAIRVNAVAPGFVKTPMFAQVERLWDAAQRERFEAQHPLAFGEPTDVANAVAFLLADTGRWITGTVLTVDGGYSAQ